jgi:hypothetical protein
MTTTFSGPVMSEGGFIGGLGGRPAGRVFYVNTNTTSAARNALRPWFDVDEDVVFSTLQGAIDACVDDRGDVIYVARGYAVITTPVLFNKAGISVIAQGYGMPPMFMGEYFAQDNTTGGAAAAIISKSCLIYGLGFHTAWTGGISSNVVYDSASGEAGWVWLHSCRFMNWTTATVYGINCEAGANMIFENCSFEGAASQPFVNAGIAFGGSATNNPIRNIVKDCWFSNCTYAIEHKDGTPQEFIYGPGNITVKATSQATKFLNSKAATMSGMVCGNFFYTDVGTGTFDQTAANMETDGCILVGNEYETEDPGPT